MLDAFLDLGLPDSVPQEYQDVNLTDYDCARLDLLEAMSGKHRVLKEQRTRLSLSGPLRSYAATKGFKFNSLSLCLSI